MKRVLVVLTGGTIGSKVTDSTVDLDKTSTSELLDVIKSRYASRVAFKVIQPLNMLSENCTTKEWTVLCEAIRQEDLKDIDGIIVTHGSDTLPYTSALISYLFCDTKIPIVLTASNYPIEDEKSNGIANFVNSVEFIMRTRLRGVFVVYQNEKEHAHVHLGTRLLEADSYHDDFISFGRESFGGIAPGVFVKNVSDLNPSINEVNSEKREPVVKSIEFVNSVTIIKAYPGLDYSSVSLSNKPKAILHELYHSATACTTEGKNSILEFNKLCKDEGIDVYVISFKSLTSEMYVTSKEIITSGAIPLQNISREAAYVKLLVAYNQEVMLPQEYVKENIFFEYL